MKTRSLFSLVAGLALLAGTVGFAEPQGARGAACDNRTVEGAYGFIQHQVPIGEVFLTMLAQLLLDGKGQLTGSVRFIGFGDPLLSGLTGSYAVQADCTGSLTVTFTDLPFLPPGELVFVAVAGGDELLTTSSSTTQSFVPLIIKRQ